MKKQLFLFLFMLLPMVAMADASGACGENVTYTFVESTHTLTISGTGAMTNYSYSSVPWHSYCSEITKAVIEDGVTSIGGDAFAYCIGLTSVTIPSSVTSISGGAFYNCSGLTSVHFTDLAAWCKILFGYYDANPLYYAHHLFLNGTEIKNLDIPNSVTSIGNYAFSGCSGLTSVNISNGVTEIGDGAFSDCTGLTSVNISNGVTEIGDGAFSGCSGLTSVSIPNSVTEIGNSAFSRCSGLTSVSIPNSVTSIGRAAFKFCSGLTSITIPNGVTSIGESAFCGCSGLTSVTIPNSVTSIGNSAFYGCSGLNSVTIPNNVTSISEYAFQDCSGLTSVIIPNNVTSIGNYAFYGCSGLTSVIIPNSLTSIGWAAFSGCSGLSSIVISDLEAWCNISFSGISSNPLYYAHHLYLNDEEIKKLVIPESVTQINPLTFQGASGFTSLTIPNHITIIPENAFQGCSGLTSITFPNQLSIIRANAFNGCSKLESLIIPASVEYIYQYAFSECTALTTINAQPTNPPFLNSNSFSNYSIPLNVPSGCAEAYRAAQGWSNFTTINDGNVYYQLSVTADNHGTVTYNSTAVKNTTKTFDVMEATNATLTLTPDEGYKVATVTVNGTDRTEDVVNGTLTISNVTANMTVNVTFGIAGETEAVTIGAEEMATFCSSNNLDFSKVNRLKAYTATGYDHGTLTVTRVLNAPAGTGLLLKGEAGSYDVPYATTTGYYINLLRGVTEETWVSPTEGNQTNYLLGNKSGVTTFYRLSAAGTLAGGNAYLQLPTSVIGDGSNSRIMRIVAEDETTGVSEVLMENGQWTNGDEVYDLQGRRVAKPSKGLYIVNGRKVVVK